MGMKRLTKNLELNYQDGNEEYNAFLSKFEVKRTTDDCFTPEAVYDAVSSWVSDEYGVDRASFVRPFWPGGDFRNFPYAEGCVVVDNPPFSIIAKICRWYNNSGIDYFLFSPSLTTIGIDKGRCRYVHVGYNVRYQNGAKVKTSFVTSLGKDKIRTSPELYRRIYEAEESEKRQRHLSDRVIGYPDELVTSSIMDKLCLAGIDFRVAEGDCLFVGSLDNYNKHIYGGGFILSEAKTNELNGIRESYGIAEREKTHRICLSQRERDALSLWNRQKENERNE